MSHTALPNDIRIHINSINNRMSFEYGEHIFINYKGKICRFIYGEYKQESGFHLLHAYQRSILLTDALLSVIIVNDYQQTATEKFIDDMLDRISFNVKKRLNVLS